jgi:hypothetical protein
LAPQRFALQLTMSQSTHDKLRYAQALLGHQVPSGDVAEVLDKALDALISQLEKRKFAATSRPRRGQGRPSTGPRHIPAHVKRTVGARDGGQCTFVSEAGRRCPARTRLEFDHVVPVARGGQATVAGIRLRCRAHNQHSAERTFGTAFMRHKREPDRDVIPWLRRLGFRADEARRASAHCESMPDASLEERVRAALSFLAPCHRRVAPPPTAAGPPAGA